MSGISCRALVAMLALVIVAARADAEPALLWERTWDSPAHGEDVAWGVATGPGGRVFVTGYTVREDKHQHANAWLGAYDAAGALLWTRERNNPRSNHNEAWHGAAADRTGGVYVTGAERRDDLGEDVNLVVMHYGPEGGVKWTFTHDGAHGEDYGIDLKVAANGDLVVHGYEDRYDLRQDWNIWTARFDPARRLLWTRTYDSPAHARDEGQALDLGPDGAAYVCGWERREDLGQGYNAWARKYSPAGDVLWTWSADADAGLDDAALAIAALPDGRAYVAGWADRADLGHAYDAWVALLDSAGRLLWRRSYDSPAHAYDYLHAAAAAPDGSVWLAGYEDRPDLEQDTNALVLQYAPDGRRLRRMSWDGAGGGADIAWALALDGTGGLVVAGSTERPGQREDIFVRRYALSATLGP